MPGIHFYPTPSLPAVSIHTSLGLSLPPEHQGSVPSPLPAPSVDTGNPYGWQYSRRWPADLWNVAAELSFVPHAHARGRVTLENPGRPCTGQRGSHLVIPTHPRAQLVLPNQHPHWSFSKAAPSLPLPYYHYC